MYFLATAIVVWVVLEVWTIFYKLYERAFSKGWNGAVDTLTCYAYEREFTEGE